MSVDVSRLTPGDCAAALRSFPRRFRAVLATFDEDEKPDDLVHRPGADGRSAAQHADHVARSIALLRQALHDVLVHDRPVLPAGVFDDGSALSGEGNGSVEAVLDSLSAECAALADTVDRTDADAWSRVGIVGGAGGRSVSALDILREAVRIGSDGLREAERAVTEARRAT
jgi:DinB superfamily